MYEEEIVEDGVVLHVRNDFAVIRIPGKGSCEECSAKIICKSNDENKKELRAINKVGALPGDKVRISIKARKVLAASVLLYGVPLIILFLSLIIGMKIFNTTPELSSALMAFLITGIYYFVVNLTLKRKDNHLVAEIMFII